MRRLRHCCSHLRSVVPVAALVVAAALACEGLSLLLVHIPGLQSQRSANAGNSFGAAAAAGSVVVLYYMARTMRMQESEQRDQRTELRLQREALQEQCRAAAATTSELNRTAEALIRSIHISLLRMAMHDPELAATWPTFDESAPPARNKQFLYVNAVLSMHLLAFETGYPEEHLEATLRRLFESRAWRDFWEQNRENRASRVPADTAEGRFTNLVERAYRSATDAMDIRRSS